MKRKCKECNKKFVVKYNTTARPQVVCSCRCMATYYLKQKPKTRKLARELSATVGRRSMAEVKFDAKFLEGKKIKAFYEKTTIEYNVAETKKYTPDWTVVGSGKDWSSKVFYIDYKGVLDNAARKKMLLVQKQHPAMDIRIVFERAKNFIYKGSKTTYGMWATKHGFPWADNVLPPEWFK